METFVGLDVSLRETSVCILDKDGTLIFEGTASEPAPIARLIRKRAPGVVRVGRGSANRLQTVQDVVISAPAPALESSYPPARQRP